MKKLSQILMAWSITLILSNVSAHTTDAPHNASVGIGCNDCHADVQNVTYADDMCLSCHTNATGGGYTKNSAPKMLTHSSQNTSATYGNWSLECRDCHNRSTMDQRLASPSGYFMVSGTITSVTDNGNGTTTFGYSGAVENYPGSGWLDYTRWNRKSGGSANGNERGLIIYPTQADLNVSFEIRSATASTITVDGSIDAAFPGAVTPGSSFRLAYGQSVNSQILGAGNIERSVKFFQNSSNNSYAFNENGSSSTTDPAPDGICQVCHSQTTHWRADGTRADHYSGAVCVTCHKHEEGFKLSCTSCHDSPPTTGKHASHFDNGEVTLGTTDVQSTSLAYSFSCGICHAGIHLSASTNPRTVDTVFAGVATQDGASGAAYSAATPAVDDPGTGYTFNYSDGTCSNVYCHGNYPGSGRKAAVSFDTGVAPCGSCHGASNADYPNSGTHYLHAGAIGAGYNYACSLCHKDTVASAGPGTYTISDKSNHVNGFLDWKFDTSDPRLSPASVYSIVSGTVMPSDGYTPRLYGTCSNIYCHSIAQTATGGPLTGAPGEYVTTQRWNAPSGTGSQSCGSCHKNGSGHNAGAPAAMDSGSHTAHLDYRFNTVNNWYAGSYKCAICHRYEPQTAGSYNSCDSCHTQTAVYERHSDGKINVTIDTAFGAATYNDLSPTPGKPGNGFFSCSNTYCHSNGTSVATIVVPGNVSPTWGSGAVSCTACHGNPPGYASGSPKANSHMAHSGESCSACHVDTTADGTTIADKSNHVNKAYNVSADVVTGVTFTYTFSSAGGSCTNVSCHGGGTAQWGSRLSCQGCHLGTDDVDDFAAFFYTNGVTAKLANAGEWDTTGHGRPGGSGNYPSGNPAANFTAPNACQYCHDSSVAHKTAANPFRLRNNADPTWGMNGVCQSCHAIGSPGIAVDAVLRNGSKKVGSTHYGARHTAGANGGQLCWDCHDPHGDSNIFMVQAAVAKTSDPLTSAPVSTVRTTFVSFSSGVGYAKSTAPFDGICNVCHTSTSHYTASSGDGHNAGVRCTSCHAHSGKTKTDAFTVNAACGSCHAGSADLDDYVYGNGATAKVSSGQWTSSGHGRAAASGGYPQSGNPAADFVAAAGDGDACLYCHDDAVDHNRGSNPFRLKWTAGPDGQNGNCQKCHKPGSSGYVNGVDGSLPSMNASTATKMGEYHWLLAPGGKHTDVRNGGKFCWDCHDPHGDMNVAMVQGAVAKRNDWNGATGYGIPIVAAATSFTTMNTWESYVNSSGTGVCQVCHEITSHFTGVTNYNTNHNPGTSCTSCHAHLGSSAMIGDAFPGAESSGGVACGGCHSDLYTRMNSATNTTYHHLLTTDAPTYTSGTCLQCHVDHNIFRPDINAGNTVGRAANLRTNSTTAPPAPPTTAGFTNSDFLASDTDGGICLSCHKAQLAKGYPQPDATTVTPAIPFTGAGKADYQASAHQYTAASTFGAGGSTFNANCSKCHNDTLNPKSSFSAQNSANKFGSHSSALGRVLAALGIASPADPLEEQFCYRCHSGAGPNDYYGVKVMSAASRDIQTVFGKTYRHNVAGYNGKHSPAETFARISANKHVECDDCHNSHAAQAGRHVRGSAALANVLKGVPGANPAYPPNSNWPSTISYAAVDPSTSEYQICFKCHSAANTNVLTWGGTGAAAWTDVGLEFDPNNQSYHPVVQALPATDPSSDYGSNQLSSPQLTGGWTPGQSMTCSDCHDSDSAASTGPHGSAVKWMLAGANKSWPYQGTAGNGGASGTFWTLSNMSTNKGTANGLFCFNCHTLNASGHIHFEESDHRRIPCVGCHVRVPHGYTESRLIAAGTVPPRYAPDGNGGGTNYINRFTKASSYRRYEERNCSTTRGCHD